MPRGRGAAEGSASSAPATPLGSVSEGRRTTSETSLPAPAIPEPSTILEDEHTSRGGSALARGRPPSLTISPVPMEVEEASPLSAAHDPVRFPRHTLLLQREWHGGLQYRFGAELAPLPLDLRARDPSLEGGLYVIGVAMTSDANRAGLLQGDIVLGLDGHSVRSKEAPMVEQALNTQPARRLQIARSVENSAQYPPPPSPTAAEVAKVTPFPNQSSTQGSPQDGTTRFFGRSKGGSFKRSSSAVQLRTPDYLRRNDKTPSSTRFAPPLEQAEPLGVSSWLTEDAGSHDEGDSDNDVLELLSTPDRDVGRRSQEVTPRPAHQRTLSTVSATAEAPESPPQPQMMDGENAEFAPVPISSATSDNVSGMAKAVEATVEAGESLPEEGYDGFGGPAGPAVDALPALSQTAVSSQSAHERQTPAASALAMLESDDEEHGVEENSDEGSEGHDTSLSPSRKGKRRMRRNETVDCMPDDLLPSMSNGVHVPLGVPADVPRLVLLFCFWLSEVLKARGSWGLFSKRADNCIVRVSPNCHVADVATCFFGLFFCFSIAATLPQRRCMSSWTWAPF